MAKYFTNEEIAESFGKLIRERRMELELTQREVAQMADVDQTYIGLLEKGERVLTLPVAMRMCIALGLNLNEYTEPYFEPYIKTPQP